MHNLKSMTLYKGNDLVKCISPLAAGNWKLIMLPADPSNDCHSNFS